MPNYPVDSFEELTRVQEEISDLLEQEGQPSEGVIRITYDHGSKLQSCYLTVPEGRPDMIAMKVLRRRHRLRRGGWHYFLRF